MPPELDFWHENNNSHSPFEAKQSNGVNNNKGVMPTLRPPLYNAEDYTAALKQMFSSSPSISLLIDHSGFSGSSSPDSIGGGANPPEMSMRKFLNGSELLFKLEADLRSSYPTFVQEFFHCDGISYVLEALKSIQAALDECNGLREQRKLILDEQKCLQCLKLCLRNIEAVSKLASYPGGLYSLAAATISTVTATRIMALEIMACVCTEGGADGHYKVSEAISTLRLRMGEPIRCKLLVGALSSAPPGTFQAKGIRFLTAWVSSAASPKQKVHIQCELEEAGFNPQGMRKAAELGGARESQEVQAELDEWDRATIDVDTMTRQNCQLRNSVATLQQELATLKDKLKRMDVPQKPEKPSQSKRSSRPPKRNEELVTTPVDSEEEAEQIHQILEDLNNIVNSEMNGTNDNVNKNNNISNNNDGHRKSSAKKEKEIVPVHLVKSPPKRSPNGVSTNIMPRPWPGSSASDDDDSDILDLCTDENKKSPRAQLGNPHELPNNKKSNSPPLPSNSSPGKGKANNNSSSANVRRVVEQLEKSVNNGPSPKLFQKQNKFPLNQIGKSINLHQSSTSSPNMGSNNNNNNNNNIVSEPKPDYTLPNFHKQNHMASKFANFKSSKLYSSSPDNSSKNYSNSYAEVYEKSSNSINSSGGGSRYNFGSRFSPNLEIGKKNTSNGVNGNHHSSGLRRSESLHASLASIELDNRNGGVGNGQVELMGNGKYGRPLDNLNHSQNYNMKSSSSVISWKSMENLDNHGGHDENFTLRWRYPHPNFQQQQQQQQQRSLTPSPKNSKGKTQKKLAQKSQGVLSPAGNSNGNGDLHLIADYRQNRFTKNSKANGAHVTPPPAGYNNNHVSSSSPNGNGNGLFPRYAKKSSEKPHHLHPQQQHQIPFSASSNNHHNEYQKEKENLKMFSLPPMLMTSNGPDSANTHRLCDLPSGLY